MGPPGFEPESMALLQSVFQSGCPGFFPPELSFRERKGCPKATRIPSYPTGPSLRSGPSLRALYPLGGCSNSQNSFGILLLTGPLCNLWRPGVVNILWSLLLAGPLFFILCFNLQRCRQGNTSWFIKLTLTVWAYSFYRSSYFSMQEVTI